MSAEPDRRTGTCLGLPEFTDPSTGVKAEAVVCPAALEQERMSVEGLMTLITDENAWWRPGRCELCNSIIEERQKVILEHNRRQELRLRPSLNGANVREDVKRGRVTLDRLAEIYAEAGIRGGVSVERYRDVVQVVRDHVSVPPLLRTAGIASILYLSGDPGTGKTWMLEAAAGHVEQQMERSALYVASPIELWARIKGSGQDGSATEATYLRELERVDLLVLDDLARKTKPTRWELEMLLQVIDARYRLNRPTLIASNYDVRALFELWADASDEAKTTTVRLLCDRLGDARAAVSVTMSGRSLRRG